MGDEGLLENYALAEGQRARSLRPYLILLAAVFTVLISGAICAGAILAPAPPVAVPLVVVICVGCPMFSSWEIPHAVAALRARRSLAVLEKLRRTLDDLPEIEHPLGL